MRAFPGGTDDPAFELARVRSRVRSRVPFMVARMQRLLLLAAVAATGSDPESSIPQLEAAERTLATFLRITNG